MQVITSSMAPASGPPLVAKPGKDDTADTFAGLLAALAGIAGLPVQIQDPTVASQAGVGTQVSAPLAAGLSQVADNAADSSLLATGPAASEDAVASPALSAGLPVLSAPVAPGSLPLTGTTGATAGQVIQAAATPPGNATQPAAQVTVPSGQAVVGPVLAAEVVAAQAAPGSQVPVTGTDSSTASGYPPQVAGTGAPGAQVTGGSGPGQPSAAPVAAPSAAPVVAPEAPKTLIPQPVSPMAAGPTPGPAQGIATPGAQVQTAAYQPGQLAPATAVAQTAGPVQSPVPNQPGNGSPGAPVSPAPGTGLGVPSGTPAASGSPSQFSPDGGNGSATGDGKGSDPGKSPQTNPLAGGPAPVFQTTPTPVSTVANLPQQAAQGIQAYLNQGGRLPARLELQLDPPALGKLTIHLAMEAGTLSVAFYTASSHARDAVAASLPQMRQLLGQQNLVLGQTSVYVGSQTGGNAGGNARGGSYPGTGIRLAGGGVVPGEERTGTQSGTSLLNILV